MIATPVFLWVAITQAAFLGDEPNPPSPASVVQRIHRLSGAEFGCLPPLQSRPAIRPQGAFSAASPDLFDPHLADGSPWLAADDDPTRVVRGSLRLSLRGTCLTPRLGLAPKLDEGARVIEKVTRVPASGKPVAPVAIDLVAGPDLGQGRQEVTIVVTPIGEAKQLRISLIASAGLALVDPAHATWTDDAQIETAIRHKVAIKTDGAGDRRLTIFATLLNEGQPQQTGVETFILNPAESVLRPAAPVPPGGNIERKPGSNSSKILEIPAGDR